MIKRLLKRLGFVPQPTYYFSEKELKLIEERVNSEGLEGFSNKALLRLLNQLEVFDPLLKMVEEEIALRKEE